MAPATGGWALALQRHASKPVGRCCWQRAPACWGIAWHSAAWPSTLPSPQAHPPCHPQLAAPAAQCHRRPNARLRPCSGCGRLGVAGKGGRGVCRAGAATAPRLRPLLSHRWFSHRLLPPTTTPDAVGIVGGQCFALDYFIERRSQCSYTERQGACPDAGLSGSPATDQVQLVSCEQVRRGHGRGMDRLVSCVFIMCGLCALPCMAQLAYEPAAAAPPPALTRRWAMCSRWWPHAPWPLQTAWIGSGPWIQPPRPASLCGQRAPSARAATPRSPSCCTIACRWGRGGCWRRAMGAAARAAPTRSAHNHAATHPPAAPSSRAPPPRTSSKHQWAKATGSAWARPPQRPRACRCWRRRAQAPTRPPPGRRLPPQARWPRLKGRRSLRWSPEVRGRVGGAAGSWP